MGNAIITERPWQHLYVDLLGPYPGPKIGHCHILIVMDQFSKFVLLKPLRQAKTRPINDFLEKEVFHLFEVPESIMSDNGAQFISNEMKALFEQYGIRHVFTAIHSPQANASTVPFSRTLFVYQI